MSICMDRAQDTNPEILRMAQEVMEQFHPELRMPDGSYVRLCILLAYHGGEDAGNTNEPAVKCHGYPCYAKISVIPFKQRVDKRADAEIIIDKAWWDGAEDRPRRALLDHEITHLQFKQTREGCLDTDDIGRPKLDLRLHDWQLGGFRSVARRWGDDALDAIEARHFIEDFGRDVLKPEKKEEPALPFAATDATATAMAQ